MRMARFGCATMALCRQSTHHIAMTHRSSLMQARRCAFSVALIQVVVAFTCCSSLLVRSIFVQRQGGRGDGGGASSTSINCLAHHLLLQLRLLCTHSITSRLGSCILGSHARQDFWSLQVAYMLERHACVASRKSANARYVAHKSCVSAAQSEHKLRIYKQRTNNLTHQCLSHECRSRLAN
jgi:hypothetical protein